METKEPIEVLVLGPGCARCQALAQLTEQAAKELGLQINLRKVTDLRQIVALGVMSTPALAVNGSIKVMGRVPSIDELKKILQAA